MTAEWIASHELLDRLRGHIDWHTLVEEALLRGTLRSRGRPLNTETAELGVAEAIAPEFWRPVTPHFAAIAGNFARIDFNTGVARRPSGRSYPRFRTFERVEFSAADVDRLWPAAGEPRGHGKAKANWEAVEDALNIEIKRRGGPPELDNNELDWRHQADAERYVAEVLALRHHDIGVTTIRKRVRGMLARSKGLA